MKTAQKPNTRQPKQSKPAPVYGGRGYTSDGVLLVDTATGYRNDELCDRLTQDDIKLGVWVVQGRPLR
jgi:hypothetical protein